VLVPSCNFLKEDILSAYKNLQVTPSLQQLLGAIADTLIPAGNIKGAADLSVQDFILVMVNDCLQAEEQKTFMRGLQQLDRYSESTGGSAFADLAQAEREKVLLAGLAIEKKDDPADEQQAVRAFLQTAKQFTIQGFMMSEYIMTQIKPYQMIPGEYQGAVLLSDIKTETIHG
jgi:hypothetical protein